jgi:PiT family inorganic phosphate transporter
MTLIALLIFAARAFEYVNGFHDAANAIATSVATRVLTARQAVLLAAACNLLGALAGTQVATTIAAGLVNGDFVMLPPFSGRWRRPLSGTWPRGGSACPPARATP